MDFEGHTKKVRISPRKSPEIISFTEEELPAFCLGATVQFPPQHKKLGSSSFLPGRKNLKK